MKKYNFYLKNFSLFLIGELFIVFVISLLNLFGLSSDITTIILLVLNILLFLFFGFNHGIKSSNRGFISGILTGLGLLVILFLIKIIFFKGDFNINMYLYYLILLLSSTLGGMFGKTKKKEVTT